MEKSRDQLNVIVDTFDKAGELVGTRTVDLYHYGTRDWLAKHSWWAMHNNCNVTQRPAVVNLTNEPHLVSST